MWVQISGWILRSLLIWFSGQSQNCLNLVTIFPHFAIVLNSWQTGELKKILKRITEGKTEREKEQGSEDLQEIMTLVQFANDECDYGMGLELGLDLFCFGSERFHNTILQLLPLGYRLLGRDEFAEIAEIHVKNRNRPSLTQLPSWLNELSCLSRFTHLTHSIMEFRWQRKKPRCNHFSHV